MSLSKIILRNFQIHRKTELNIHEGINIIAGSSGNGKSSVIRAIRWLCENSPRGFKFRRWKAPEKSVTSVSFVLDGETITRKRNATTNSYDFKGHNYKALKTDVPEDIQEELNISEFNIQRQFEGPFLFSKSSSEVAKMINSVAGIEVIDAILKETNARHRKAKAEVTLLAGMLQSKTATVSSLKHFVGLKKMEAGILKDLEGYESVSERIDKLSSFLKSLQKKIDKAEQLSGIPDISKKLSRTTKLLRKYRDVVDGKQNSLERILRSLNTALKVKYVSQDQQDMVAKRLKVATKTAYQLKAAVELGNSCKTILHRINVASDKVLRNNKEAKIVEGKLASIKKEAGVCPLCGNKFK